jgi:hypothetical protein
MHWLCEQVTEQYYWQCLRSKWYTIRTAGDD